MLWLWRRPASIAPIGPLAWELPYAVDVALKKQNIKKKKKKKVSWVLLKHGLSLSPWGGLPPPWGLAQHGGQRPIRTRGSTAPGQGWIPVPALLQTH